MNSKKPMQLAFGECGSSPIEREGTIANTVGMLILTHHRLPDGSDNHLRLQPDQHVNSSAQLNYADLKIANGSPFWHSEKWRSRLSRAAGDLKLGIGTPGFDIGLRAVLMFADHLGSALRETHDTVDGHLGNTKDGKLADPLDVHIDRVWQRILGCYDMLHRHRERYPALDENEVPIDILHPEPEPEPFSWQTTAARAARVLCERREGDFFACLMAGTGTGKTRGAPTVLAAAAFPDARPERRYLRMTLALGLRSLATQSAQEYVDELGFDRDDVSVLIGQPPVRFNDSVDPSSSSDGSQSLIALPEWLRVEPADGGVPTEGEDREADWLRRLSYDTDRGLPTTLDLVIEHASNSGASARTLAAAPIIVGTVDHLMGVASPVNSRFLLQAVRVLTSDLILDEIDQYDPEDIAAIGRLVYQTAAGGRRVIIMSATLTGDVAIALYDTYRKGWCEYALASGMPDHVNVLFSGDAAGSCMTNANGEAFEQLYEACRKRTVAALEVCSPQRRGRILAPCTSWDDLIRQVDAECTTLHAATARQMDSMKVSVGFVRMTRIAHTVALAVKLPAGLRNGRMRLKLCLHSQFPRLHRAWIERELKRALTHKGRDPDAGLRRLCAEHHLIQRAREADCNELEIVVVASPMIETGNDLDFDWAILDPSSMRAVVQAAGRVWRHRKYASKEPNVVILGRSPIVMQTGKLARPGVETSPHRDTGVPRVDRDKYGERHFTELAGEPNFERVDARAILDEGYAPLRDKEAELRRCMIDTGGVEVPLGCYIRQSTARLNRRMTRSRVFRRSTTRDLLYFRDGENLDDANWMLDIAPGTQNSSPHEAASRGLCLCDRAEPHLVFLKLNELAWKSHLRCRQSAAFEVLPRRACPTTGTRASRSRS
jgi:CRISPR-associated endonuclease/helicase Cas3